MSIINHNQKGDKLLSFLFPNKYSYIYVEYVGTKDKVIGSSIVQLVSFEIIEFVKEIKLHGLLVYAQNCLPGFQLPLYDLFVTV